MHLLRELDFEALSGTVGAWNDELREQAAAGRFDWIEGTPGDSDQLSAYWFKERSELVLGSMFLRERGIAYAAAWDSSFEHFVLVTGYLTSPEALERPDPDELDPGPMVYLVHHSGPEQRAVTEDPFWFEFGPADSPPRRGLASIDDLRGEIARQRAELAQSEEPGALRPLTGDFVVAEGGFYWDAAAQDYLPLPRRESDRAAAPPPAPDAEVKATGPMALFYYLCAPDEEEEVWSTQASAHSEPVRGETLASIEYLRAEIAKQRAEHAHEADPESHLDPAPGIVVVAEGWFRWDDAAGDYLPAG